MKWRKFMLTTAITSLLLLSSGYWYVFVAGAPQLDPPAVEPDTGLTFQLETFGSRAMGEVRQYGIILPPDYNRSPQKRYPVIILLHGGHGDARTYEDKAAITSVLHDLYQSHKLPPAIAITPDGNDKRGTSPLWDSNYFDGPNGNVGTLIGSELVAVLKSRYRTLEDPKYWALGGQSSGGWGAFNIGLRHLENFNILSSSSGYFTDTSGTENSPQDFIADIPPQQRQKIRIFLDAGEEDKEFRTSTLKFHETLEKLGISHEFHIYPGGHGIVGPDSGWNYWHKHLFDQLSYVGKQWETVRAR